LHFILLFADGHTNMEIFKLFLILAPKTVWLMDIPGYQEFD
jgi:hypothetical protein